MEKDYNDESLDEILIKGPSINSILEYDENKMIVSIEPCDLLIIENF